MSAFPLWWDTDITVFNRREDTATHVVRWYKSQIKGCFWSHKSDRVSVGETVLATDYTICRIPKSEKFLERYQWEQLSDDEISDHFTLGVGDIIVKGLVDDEIDEYAKGKRSTDFIQKHKGLRGCIEVNEISLNTGSGRNNEHYYVKGS